MWARSSFCWMELIIGFISTPWVRWGANNLERRVKQIFCFLLSLVHIKSCDFFFGGKVKLPFELLVQRGNWSLIYGHWCNTDPILPREVSKAIRHKFKLSLCPLNAELVIRRVIYVFSPAPPDDWGCDNLRANRNAREISICDSTRVGISVIQRIHTIRDYRF